MIFPCNIRIAARRHSNDHVIADNVSNEFISKRACFTPRWLIIESHLILIMYMSSPKLGYVAFGFQRRPNQGGNMPTTLCPEGVQPHRLAAEVLKNRMDSWGVHACPRTEYPAGLLQDNCRRAEGVKIFNFLLCKLLRRRKAKGACINRKELHAEYKLGRFGYRSSLLIPENYQYFE